MIALPSHHPLTQKMQQTSDNRQAKPRIHLVDLRNDPFIVLGQKLRELTINLCRQAGFEPRIILQTKNADVTHSLVAVGMGVAFIPDTLTWFGKMSADERPCYF